MENERIRELIDALYKHHEDYGQGRTQNFSMVCYDCKKAADALLYFLEHHEPKQNVTALKECIVRLVMKANGIKVE